MSRQITGRCFHGRVVTWRWKRIVWTDPKGDSMVTFPFHTPPNQPKEVSLQKLFHGVKIWKNILRFNLLVNPNTFGIYRRHRLRLKFSLSAPCNRYVTLSRIDLSSTFSCLILFPGSNHLQITKSKINTVLLQFFFQLLEYKISFLKRVRAWLEMRASPLLRPPI